MARFDLSRESAASGSIAFDEAAHLFLKDIQPEKSQAVIAAPHAESFDLNKYSPTRTDRLEDKSHVPENQTDRASRLITSTATGCISQFALHMAGLQHVPKIGVPCAIAAPFILSGMVSSYEKTKTFTDPRAFGEGLLVYGGFSGMKNISRTIESRLAGIIERSSMSAPLSTTSHVDAVLRSPRQFVP